MLHCFRGNFPAEVNHTAGVRLMNLLPRRHVLCTFKQKYPKFQFHSGKHIKQTTAIMRTLVNQLGHYFAGVITFSQTAVFWDSF